MTSTSVIGAEGRLADGLFLTAWLWEEGKHTEFFRRFLDEVVGDTGDLHQADGGAPSRGARRRARDICRLGQYGKRIARIERARAGGSLELGDDDED